jgi:hypothetical protein
VNFTTGIRMGTMDGRHLAMDEYGRDPRHPRFEDPRRRGRSTGPSKRARGSGRRRGSASHWPKPGSGGARIRFTTG